MLNKPVTHVAAPPAGRCGIATIAPRPMHAGSLDTAPRSGIVSAEPSLESLTSEINEAHRQASAAARSSLEHARHAGELLLNVKRRLAHGDWIPWLEEEFAGSVRTAQFYMRIATGWSQIKVTDGKPASTLPLREAVRLLGQPSDRPRHRVSKGPSQDLVVELALSSAARAVFLRRIADLQELLGTNGITETVCSVIDRAYNEWTNSADGLDETSAESPFS